MVDIVIITTLDVEFNAVVNELNLTKSENELEAYGSINNYNILCIKSTIRGNIESAINTITTLLADNNPKYVFLVGYAGGINGREGIDLNKVVVANQIKYFEYKKIINGKPYPREPNIITPSTRITDKAQVLAQANNNIIIGEILSGETITNELNEELLKRYDKAVAVETEAGGIGYAITKFMYKEDRVIHYGVIKGISDFVNVKESSKDREQNARSASIEAAKVTRAIIEKLTSEYVKNNLLKEYLAYVEELYYKPNKIDNRALPEYYIEPNLIKVSVDTWYKEIDKIKEYSKWNIDDFLNSSDWLTIIGAEFGMGKSSYAKHIAYYLAKTYLEGKDKHGYIPIYVNLAAGFDDNRIFLSYTTNQVINMLDGNNVLLILDGLDEYPQNIKDLLKNLENLSIVLNTNKRKLKVLITTRLIENYPEILKIQEYVRLKPFTKDQVNEFFKKYNIDLTYDELQMLGFSDEDITKPLFAWMWAYMYSINKELFKNLKSTELVKLDVVTRNRIVRTLLYHNFINTIVRGKHREEAPERFKKSYLAEKEVLRVIAAIYNIYGKLEGDMNKLVEPFKIEIENLNKALDYITESYFYIQKETYTFNKVYRFIHKSMQEYLLAEYYYKNIKDGNIYRLNVGEPSIECIEFLHGLIDIHKHYDVVKDMLDYPEGVDLLINENDYNKIVNNCKKIIEDDRIILFGIEENKNGNFVIGKANNANRYENLFVHKWVAVSILSWLTKDNEYLNVDKLEYLIRISSGTIAPHLKNLSRANLSRLDLSRATLYLANLPRADLSGANLSYANLFFAYLSKAILSGADLSGANLSYANLSEANLIGANLIGARLNFANLIGANLIGARLNFANLIGANLSRANLAGVIFYLFTWNETHTINNLEEWLGRIGFKVKKFEFNNNILNITTDKGTITIELKGDKAILKVGNHKEELLAFKENGKIKIYLPIEVNGITYTKGIILTYMDDEKSILNALENLPPNFRKIVLRDNPNYKKIWSKYHGNNSQD